MLNIKNNKIDFDKVGFIILKPDTVYQGLENNIWSFFKERGFKLIGMKSFDITKERRKKLYKDFFVSSRTNWGLGGEFYSLGKSLGLIVTCSPPKEFQTTSSYISDYLKGNFIPEKAQCDTVRGKFNAINPVFNLIHSSDDTENLMREINIFFNPEELKNIFIGCIEEPILDFKKSKQILDFTDIYFKVKKSLYSLGDYSNDNDYLEYLNSKHRYLKQIKVQDLRLNFLSYLREENNLYKKMIKKDTYLNVFCDYENFQKLDYDTLFKEIEDKGIILDKWEKYLLKTTMYYVEFC
ncbi:nucleoside-diphosphate kinase [Bacillus thuringiensis]|uniref:nucleoside-diphosphate kinase n=1 Tax=Bacillus thuringiensis TaxID=1428 RepID=UPI000BFC46E0|nr:nucleoside-diphosphate kinase [Bacillus thuringiensis]PGO54956.1 hypothetical protein CN986_15700 [Bacillus thuringiensis]